MYSSHPGARGDIGNPTPKGLHQGATLVVHAHDATPSGQTNGCLAYFPGFDEYIEPWALGCNAFSVEYQ